MLRYQLAKAGSHYMWKMGAGSTKEWTVRVQWDAMLGRWTTIRLGMWSQTSTGTVSSSLTLPGLVHSPPWLRPSKRAKRIWQSAGDQAFQTTQRQINGDGRAETLNPNSWLLGGFCPRDLAANPIRSLCSDYSCHFLFSYCGPRKTNFYFFVVLLFWKGVSCHPGWSWTHPVCSWGWAFCLYLPSVRISGLQPPQCWFLNNQLSNKPERRWSLLLSRTSGWSVFLINKHDTAHSREKMAILLGHLLNCIMKLADYIHSIFTKSMGPVFGEIWFLGSVKALAGKIALQSVFLSQNAWSIWVPVFILLWTVCFVRTSVADSYYSTNTKLHPGLFRGYWSSWSFYRHMLEEKYMKCKFFWALALRVFTFE